MYFKYIFCSPVAKIYVWGYFCPYSSYIHSYYYMQLSIIVSFLNSLQNNLNLLHFDYLNDTLRINLLFLTHSLLPATALWLFTRLFS